MTFSKQNQKKIVTLAFYSCNELQAKYSTVLNIRRRTRYGVAGGGGGGGDVGGWGGWGVGGMG
jgi:hypothetical protein